MGVVSFGVSRAEPGKPLVYIHDGEYYTIHGESVLLRIETHGFMYMCIYLPTHIQYPKLLEKVM